MSKKVELLKNTLIIFMGKVATQFLSFFLLPIYTNFLSTEDYGSVDLIITYISLFVPIITIQQEMATFRYLVDARNDEERKKKIVSTSLRNVTLHLLIFLALYFILIYFIDFKYKYYILLNISICIFSNLFLQIARGFGKNVNYAIASFITGAITFTSNIILICFLNFGAKGMLLSMSIANTFCILFLFLSLKLYKYISVKSIDKVLRKDMLKYSLPLVPNGISWWFINVSDRTIISLILGVGFNGIYAVANKFPSIISSLLGIFSLSWSESASLHINDDDRDEFFSNVAETVLELFSCACFGIIAILPFIYKYIVGVKFLDSYNYVPIFLIGSISSCIVNVYSAIYIAKKETKKVASTSIASAIINIVINLIFIKYLGLYAAAISTAMAYFIMMIYRHFDVKKYVTIKYNKLVILLTVIMFALTISAYYYNNFICNIISLIIVIVYSIILNKKYLSSLLKKLKKKKKHKKETI